jgi:hypothetical protein
MPRPAAGLPHNLCRGPVFLCGEGKKTWAAAGCLCAVTHVLLLFLIRIMSGMKRLPSYGVERSFRIVIGISFSYRRQLHRGTVFRVVRF